MVQYNGFPNRLILISGLQIPKITCVHTTQRETISIREALEKDVMTEKMKLILKARTQMVESIYRSFETTEKRSSFDKNTPTYISKYKCIDYY